jgi:hypothetical protein
MVRIILLTIVVMFLRWQVLPAYEEYMQNYWWVEAQTIKIEKERIDIEKARLCFTYGWCEGPFAPKPLPNKDDET